MRVGKSAHSWRGAIVVLVGMVCVCVVDCDPTLKVGLVASLAGGYNGFHVRGLKKQGKWWIT